jgi:hypothetical protein
LGSRIEPATPTGPPLAGALGSRPAVRTTGSMRCRVPGASPRHREALVQIIVKAAGLPAKVAANLRVHAREGERVVAIVDFELL